MTFAEGKAPSQSGDIWSLGCLVVAAPGCFLLKSEAGAMEEVGSIGVHYWGYIGIMEKKMETTFKG